MKGAKTVLTKKEINMKNSTRLLLATGALVALISGSPAARAGNPSQGIAASPRLRAQLNERNAQYSLSNQQSPTQSTITPQALLAGSPRNQQMLSERPQMNPVQASSEVAAFKPIASDGIAASPKVRAQLNERRQSVEIAPLK